MAFDHVAAVETVRENVIEPEAIDIDAAGRFPRAAMDALAEAGLLGLISSAEVGGAGAGLDAAADVVRRIGRSCASTAMVTAMHYSGTVVLEAVGPVEVRRAIAEGAHLTTLAFSEKGSRSHFWAPTSSAHLDGDEVVLDARKSWITAAGEADSYVWSSQPVAAEGMSTLWFVPSDTEGLKVDAPFDGLGLRGNASSPVSAAAARIPADHRLGDDGGGFDLMMGVVLPTFSVLNAAASVGLMEATVQLAAAHLVGTRLEHLDATLADDPVLRSQLASARFTTDAAATLLSDTVAALAEGRDDAQLRVLEVKAVAGDGAISVTDTAMRVCGGSAFRKEVGVERRFRDGRAAAVMAPTGDALRDFVGKAVCGLPLF
ncbi:MAG: acyl-CoA/acyl-ACP dehydrogenase [Acidimicrobiia bacterium]|nr:acyl-CoA/acyl-ACP dehydrogenase [Acidimicrobiia bacterium]